jgi:hypothetical protein
MPQRTRSHVKDYSRNPDVRPRTQELLRQKRWYGNGPPLWLVGKLQRPAQTADDPLDTDPASDAWGTTR